MKRTKLPCPSNSLSDHMPNLKILAWGDIKTLREQLSKEQQGICPICKREINAPCLDHSHVKRIKGTGQIRGVLCRGCNVMVGKIENNCTRYSIAQTELPQILRNMALYLEQPHLLYIHPSEAPKPSKLKKSSYNKLRKVAGEKCPGYPKSGKLTKPLKKLYNTFQLQPEFYS